MDGSLTLEEYERLNPRCEVPCDGGSLTYLTPNVFTRWRVESLHKKEPDTIAWIASFAPGDLLVDVGANMGLYSLWAAKTRDAQVFAFEPEAQNYALLNRNIFFNQLNGRIMAYCAAISDVNAWSELHLSKYGIGESGHSLGEKVDFKHDAAVPAYTQGCIAARLDDLVARGTIPQPHHIKIDIDGFEPKVIAGAAAVLADPKLRSLLIEINHNLADHHEMIRTIAAYGFGWDPAQVSRAERKSGKFKGCAEYVFRR